MQFRGPLENCTRYFDSGGGEAALFSVEDDEEDDEGVSQRSGLKVRGEGKTLALRCCRAGVMEKMVPGGRM
jgi:hypothetical protein